MRNPDGVGPGGAPAAPKPTPNPGPPKTTFESLSAAEQLRVVEILRPGFERALARWRERKRLEALAAEAEHVKAA
jgi:hypothetical protein